MAMNNNELTTGKVFLQNVKYLKLIPYTGETYDTLGSQSYQFDSLLADTVSLQNDDPTTNQRDSETKDEPVIQNTVLGAYQFAATSLDVQDEILTSMMGWAKGGESDTDVAYAPVAYQPLWCMAVIAFNSTKKCIVVPRLKLNSKLVIASLKTGSGELQLAGTAYAGKLQIGGKTIETPIASVPDEKLGTVVKELGA